MARAFTNRPALIGQQTNGIDWEYVPTPEGGVNWTPDMYKGDLSGTAIIDENPIAIGGTPIQAISQIKRLDNLIKESRDGLIQNPVPNQQPTEQALSSQVVDMDKFRQSWIRQQSFNPWQYEQSVISEFNNDIQDVWNHVFQGTIPYGGTLTSDQAKTLSDAYKQHYANLMNQYKTQADSMISNWQEVRRVAENRNTVLQEQIKDQRELGQEREKIDEQREYQEEQRRKTTVAETRTRYEDGVKITEKLNAYGEIISSERDGEKPSEPKDIPSSDIQQIGEYQAYQDTLAEIQSMIDENTIDTGPFEWIKKALDNWGIMPKTNRIELRSLVARLPGLMYAMRGKQLSDKELQVALDMMPQMKEDEIVFIEKTKKFTEYMTKVLSGKEAAYAGAGYGTGAFGGKGGNIPTPQTQEEYDALPSGTIYIDPDDGKQYRKP